MQNALSRCVQTWCDGATGVSDVKRLSGGASQETWSFDIAHRDGARAAILRRAPQGYGAAPGRAAGLDAESVLMRQAYAAGVPSPQVLHVLRESDDLGTGFIMGASMAKPFHARYCAIRNTRRLGLYWPARSVRRWRKFTICRCPLCRRYAR